MPNKKLLEIVRSLPPARVKRLRLFLQSPYFNNGYNAQQITELFEKIIKAGAVEEHPELDKAKLSKHFFPGKPFREKEKNPIDSLASDLFQQLRKFILEEDLAKREGDEDHEQIALARFYRENNMEERFLQTVLSIGKSLKGIQFHDSAFFQKQFQLAEEVVAFQNLFGVAGEESNLIAIHEHLDAYYSLLKLEFACALDFQRQRIEMNVGHTLSLTEPIMNIWQNAPHLQAPLNIMYVKVLSLLNNAENVAAIEDFDRQLDSLKNQIPPIKFRNLKAYFRYFYGRNLMQKGGKEAFAQMFNLYEKHLAEGYFYVDGKLLPGSLKTLVNMALKLGKADWAEKLLQDHPPERITGTRYPEESHKLCLAEVLFYKKEFDKANETLVYRLFENINYSILADVLLVKIYFETKNELLENRMRALEQKVRRSGLSVESKEPYLNFLKKLDKVVKYGWQKNSEKLVALAVEIKTTKSILERDWLLRILNL